MNKETLFQRGVALLTLFCSINKVKAPEIRNTFFRNWHFDACAYYRPMYIAICLDKCAHIGRVGRSWSYPGYTVDRTPFGVLQHELGHHADTLLSGEKRKYMGDFSYRLREEAGEEALTSYSPNHGEWFAEMFRLFVTNPNLLKILRPKTYAGIKAHFKPVVKGSWDDVLQEAPERTLNAARNKVLQARGLPAVGKQRSL